MLNKTIWTMILILQVRMPVTDVAPVVRALSQGKMTWTQVTEKYPIFEQQENAK